MNRTLLSTVLFAALAAPALASAQGAPAGGPKATPTPAAQGATTTPAATAETKPAADLQSMTLADALARFKRESLALQAAKFELDASRADIIAAGVLTNPNLGVNANLFLQGTPTGAKQTFNVTVDQVLPIGGQIGLRKEVAEAYASAAERDFAATWWTLVSNVRDSYLALQVAQAKIKLVKASIADLDKVEGIIVQRTTAGANAQYDLIRLRVERSDLTAQLADAEAGIATAQSNLAQSIGRGVDPSTLGADDELPTPPDNAESVQALLPVALRQRPEVAAAQARVRAGDVKISQIKREYFPSPDVMLGYNPWFNVPTDQGNKNGSAVFVGVTLPIPLFDHGQGKVDRAQAELRGAQVQLDATKIGVQFDVQRSVSILETRIAAWHRYRDQSAGQVDQLRTVAESAYKEGKSGILELLDGYRASLAAKNREVDLRAAAVQASLDLERTLGPKNAQP